MCYIYTVTHSDFIFIPNIIHLCRSDEYVFHFLTTVIGPFVDSTKPGSKKEGNTHVLISLLNSQSSCVYSAAFHPFKLFVTATLLSHGIVFGEVQIMNMRTETNSSPSSSPSPATAPSPAAATTPSSSGKRSRDPEDEVYVDNLHSHKRYLSEIMASSLNGLSVGDDQPLTDNPMESPARSESMFYLRDELPLQYSPMSEDSDDSRYLETSTNTCSSLSDSRPTSPVSPYRNQRLLSGNYSCPYSPASASQPRQRGSDSEGRFPSSPSDICHSADLRRAALMRSVQMRTQPTGPLSSGQENGQNMETEERPCSYMKSLVDDRGYIEECSVLSMVESENQEKPCENLDSNLIRDNPGE